MSDIYRGPAPVRIQLDDLSVYPLLIGQSLDDALKEHRARHQRFRWWQRRLPPPNGWAGLGLVGASILYGGLTYPSAIDRGLWVYFGMAAILAVFSPIVGARDIADKRNHASPVFLGAHTMNCLSIWVIVLRRHWPAPVPHLALLLSALVYTTLVGSQFLGWILRRRNGGYWDPRDFAEAYPIHELVEATRRDLEPAKRRLQDHSLEHWRQADGQTLDSHVTHPDCWEAERRLKTVEDLIGKIEETAARSRDPRTLERLPGAGDEEERLRADLVHAYNGLLQALKEADPATAEDAGAIPYAPAKHGRGRRS